MAKKNTSETENEKTPPAKKKAPEQVKKPKPLNKEQKAKLTEAEYVIRHSAEVKEKVEAGLTEEQAKQIVAAQGREDGDL